MYHLINLTLQWPAGVHLKSGQVLEADLVVDASGKASAVSKWLEKLGHPPAPAMSVDGGLRYATCTYELSPDPERTWSAGICRALPTSARAATLISIEDNKWQASSALHNMHTCHSCR